MTSLHVISALTPTSKTELQKELEPELQMKLQMELTQMELQMEKQMKRPTELQTEMDLQPERLTDLQRKYKHTTWKYKRNYKRKHDKWTRQHIDAYMTLEPNVEPDWKEIDTDRREQRDEPG
jgi:hypothetical protein